MRGWVQSGSWGNRIQGVSAVKLASGSLNSPSTDEHYTRARHSTGVEGGPSRGAGVAVREGGTWDVTWGSGSGEWGGSAGIQATHLLLLLV